MIHDHNNYFIVAVNAADQPLALGILGGHEIRACYVTPDVVGKGFGKAILLALEAEARRRGIAKLELGSTRHALEFYRRNGYKQTSAEELLLRGVIPYIPMEKML
ncbi:MAG: GNAT family N-acetyltransferase [Oligoflexia bacterium]|nr:GNAT family N-acetyltransferase [Oligoflexia bacterium]